MRFCARVCVYMRFAYAHVKGIIKKKVNNLEAGLKMKDKVATTRMKLSGELLVIENCTHC